MCLVVNFIRSNEDFEELALHCEYRSPTEVKFFVLQNYVERGLEALPEGMTFELISDFVRKSLKDNPDSFTFLKGPYISASVDMHIVDDGSCPFCDDGASDDGASDDNDSASDDGTDTESEDELWA